MIADATSDSAGATGFIALGALAVIYFAPSIVAAANKRTSTGAIVALNLLLGWTFLGWVVAFVWALKTDPVAVVAAGMSAHPQVQRAEAAIAATNASPSIVGPAPRALQSALERECPACLSWIPLGASVCRYCRRDIPPTDAIG